MESLSSGRNLLFGVLALQMDFITREALIAAVSAWILDKTRSLEDILVEQGALSTSRRAILDPLVSEHIKAHGGDLQKSLSSITALTLAREDLERMADPEVQLSLASLVSISTRVDDSWTTRVPTGGVTTSSGLRFHFLRPHEAGGLGIVSVALDRELNREVALKEIQEKHADDPQKRSRFLLEAEITGALEHPGIVPVYGLGQYEDGRPYYAMRFIRGDSLKHAISRFHQEKSPGKDPGDRTLQLRELLGRFVDVCDAMAYAHSRGILHRDIKPGNIMLGPFGETLVVDWGLAKSVNGPDDSSDLKASKVRPSLSEGLVETLMGSAIGTPAYMSPEQAEGRLDRLGPASDVYSLGATLYHLLTGVAPFGHPKIGMLLSQVTRGEFPAPRSVNSQVPHPLEAICLKAMARDPDDRYVSPIALAEDLKSWLAGEPVTAYREPWTTRAARWGRRHKTTVAVAASLLITSVVGLAITTVLLGWEKEKTSRNFIEARNAADGFLTRITNDTQLAQPGLQPLRKRLLEAGVSYYENFAREGFDPGDFARLADAYDLVARINTQVGSVDKALVNSRNALAYYERIAQSKPGDPSAKRELANALNHYSQIQYESGKSSDARSSLDRAREIGELLDSTHPQNETRRVLATTYLKLGVWHQKSLERPKAAEFYVKAVDIFEKLAQAAPTSVAARSDLADARFDLGAVQVELLRPDQARAEFERARTIRAQLLTEKPNDSKQLAGLARIDEAIGQILNMAKNYPEALAALKTARDSRESVLADNSVADYQADLGEDHEEISKDERYLNNLDEAMKSAERARAIAVRLVLFHPEVLRSSFLLARSDLAIGKVFVAKNQQPQARLVFENAIKILRSPEFVKSGDSRYRRYLVDALSSLGKLGPDALPRDEALRSLEDAREILQGLADEKSGDAELQNNLATSLTLLADLKANLNDKAGAIDLYLKAREKRLKVIATYPNDLNARIGIAVSLNNLAILLMNDNQDQIAIGHLKEALGQQKFVFNAASKNAVVRKNLTDFSNRLAGLQRKLGQVAEAAATEQELQSLLKEKP